jgi:hypothetical protein
VTKERVSRHQHLKLAVEEPQGGALTTISYPFKFSSSPLVGSPASTSGWVFRVDRRVVRVGADGRVTLDELPLAFLLVAALRWVGLADDA